MAPCCRRCPHMLVVHGAGKCAAPGCTCPSDEYAWGLTDDETVVPVVPRG